MTNFIDFINIIKLGNNMFFYCLINWALKAKRPLVIVGKGAAFSNGAAEKIRAFIKATNLPFLATPMGKGCVPDNDPHSVGPARLVLCISNANIKVITEMVNSDYENTKGRRRKKGLKRAAIFAC